MWESFAGHVAGEARPATALTEQRDGEEKGSVITYTYRGPVIPKDLDEVPIVNFWIFGDEPSVEGPEGGEEQELVVRSFRYRPLGE